MKIVFLLYNAYGIGGTIRSVVNLSSALSTDHTVEIASVHRMRDSPLLQLDPRVTIVPLIDARPDAPAEERDDPAATRPSELFTDDGVVGLPIAPTRRTDERVAAYLRETDADVVIATRPVLNGYLARYGSDRYVRIGQEHLLLQMHSDHARTGQNEALTGLDAFVTVSESDAADYRAALPGVGTRIRCIPNCSSPVAVTPSTGNSRTVVAAGRLLPVKRYDRLVDAFAKVAVERPEWQLRLYGRGMEKAALRRRIEEGELHNHIRLMGPVSPIETEWAKGAIAAVASDNESFGMTIIEAMQCGVPVVATDCPYGPGEIITHGQDGILSPLEGGADALADALIRLIDDEEARRRIAAAGQRRAEAYTPRIVADRYVELIEEVRESRHRGRGVRKLLRGGRLRGVRSPGRFSAHAPAAATEPSAVPATARCTVLPDGGLSVCVRNGGLPGGPHDLLLRLRRDSQGREVRVPLAPAADGAGAVAVLGRNAHLLAEGRWDCYAVPRGAGGGGRRQRLIAELVEQAELLTLPPVTDDVHGVSAWIPYTTSDGYLAVRTWLRPAYAEVEQVDVGVESVEVTAALLGTEAPAAPTTGGYVLAASRQGSAYDFELPVRPLGGGRFAFTLPLEVAVARRSTEQDLWDLVLRPRPEDEQVPLGRITGDIVQRKLTDVFPAVHLEHAERGPVRLRPYFTAHNALALSARDLAPASV